MLAFGQVEGGQESGDDTGLAIIELPVRLKGDKDIVVEVSYLRGGAVLTLSKRGTRGVIPGGRAQKPLPGHPREGTGKGFRFDACDNANLLRVEAAALIEREWGVSWHCRLDPLLRVDAGLPDGSRATLLGSDSSQLLQHKGARLLDSDQGQR